MDLCAGDYSVVVDPTTLPGGFAPSPCAAGGDPAVDNNCSPANVNLPTDASLALTLDFGYEKDDYTLYCFADMSDCPCGNDFPAGGCMNMSGVGATLMASGTGSVAADDLVLSISGVPALEPGILTMGGSAIRTPFANGLRCVGSGSLGVIRFAPIQTDAVGNGQYGPGIVAQSCAIASALACIQAGDVRYFQFWSRDPVGTCDNKSNLTNAVSVCFRP